MSGARRNETIVTLIERLGDPRGVFKRSAARKLATLGVDARPALAALLDAMDDADSTVRVEAARALRAIGETSLVPRWIAALGDDDPSVVWEAERALVDLRDRAVPALIEELAARTAIGRGKVGPVLGRIGVPAAPALLALRESDESELRYRASAALAHIEHTAPDDAIAAAMSSDALSVRRFAAHVMVMRASPDAVPAWIERLGDADPWLRQTAARALAGLAEDAQDAQAALIRALGDDDTAVAIEAARALGAIRGKAAIPDLVAAFHGHAALRSAIVHALCDIKQGSSGLVQCGPRAIETLREIARSDHSDRVRVAAEALGAFGPKSRDAVPVLLDALPDLRVHYPVHLALIHIGEPAVAPLLDRFDADPDARLNIASILGEIGDLRAFSALLDALRACDAGDARVYIEALGQLGDARALPAIEPFVAAEDSQTRQTAVLALGAIGELSTASLVSERLDDEDIHVKLAAVRALEQIADPAVIPILVDAVRAAPRAEVREQAAESLGSFGQQGRAAVPALIDALKDDSQGCWEYISDAWHKPGGDTHYWVRFYAARSLGEIGDRAATAALARAAHDNADDWWVREEVALALGKLGGDEALAALRALVDDPQQEVRDAASAGLERWAGDAAGPHSGV